jgi:hypothetical protein
VAPAAGQTEVTLTALTGTGSGQIYADENPTVESMGLLSKDYGNLNTDENIIPKLPLSFNYTTSLVAVIQRDEGAYGGCGTSAIVGCCADAYQVITIMDSVPANNGSDMFRPNITRAYKELMTWDDFDLSRLPTHDIFGAGPADAGSLEGIRVVWSHNTEVLSHPDSTSSAYSEGGRAFRADLITDDYAASVASGWYHNVFAMMGDDHTRPEKKEALAAMLTYGKDLFYSVYDHDGNRRRYFGGGAGQSQGRFPAAVFFAALSRDPLFAETLKRAGTNITAGTDGTNPVELNQVNIGVNGPVWGDGPHDITGSHVGRYWSELYGAKNYDGAPTTGTVSGKKTSRDPYGYVDGPPQRPMDHYAGLTSGQHRALAAVMFLMPEVCDIVNYDPLVTYAIRLSEVGRWASPDPCAPPDPREDPACSPYYVNAYLSNPDYYRDRCNCKYYGLFWDSTATSAPTWGPDPDSVAKGNWTACIRNGNDPNTGQPQQGRFSQWHGDKLSKFGYVIYEVEGKWDVIRNGQTKCKRPADPVQNFLRAVVPQPGIFRVWPNPSTGYIRIQGPHKEYLVYDHAGNLVEKAGKIAILKEGVYFISTPDRAAIRKVVIVRSR